MPVKAVPSDSRQVSLRRWRVMEIEAQDGTRSRHVWGHDVTNGLGRASSAIVKFDPITMIVCTRSGKDYRLVGLPGKSRLGQSAWHNWCIKNQVVFEVDVTSEYLNINQLSTLTFEKIKNSVKQ